ncbi:MAG: hypothetical protein KGO22_00475 [Gammaproteobacteria bacterium]|nr:hypothetical protein [Gammaproteobacteria bacterium]
MPSIPARAAPVCATALIAAAALTGCGSMRLSTEPPPGVHLAGDWKLDSARSDDLGKAVDQLRTQAQKARRGMGGQQGAAAGQASGSQRAHRGRRGQQGGQAEEAESAAGPGGGDEMGAGPPRSSSVDELMSNVPQGDYLRIRVSANAFTVTSGDSSDQYTPGLESDISAEQGDAHQMSGWKGEEYVIDTKPQFGAEIIQTYGLTKDGRLTVTLRLSARGTKLTFTRVYDRTTHVAPLAPPNNS